METKLKAIGYHRVSTVEQHADNARAELTQVAAIRGFDLVDIIEETGSGARNDRAGLQRLMELARGGKINVVMVWKLDRFGRSALDLLHNIRLLESYGVRFISTTQGIDVQPNGDPMSKMIVTMLAAIAEFERNCIIERTRLGLRAARAKGHKLGRRAREVDLDKALELRGQGKNLRQISMALKVPRSTLARKMAEATP